MIHNIFAADAKTKVILAQQSTITGLKATTRVKISSLDIQEAISNNIPIETDIIASACMFTTNKNGDYDLTVTSARKYLQGKKFAIYNSDLGKITTSLWIHSFEEPNKKELIPGEATPLQNHSDINSVGTNCRNQVIFNLKIEAGELRNAKSGTYDFGFTASTTEYSG